MADWFGALTGLPDDRPETVRAGIATDGPDLVLPNGRRLHAGTLLLPSLSELRGETVPRRGPNRLIEVVGDAAVLHADPAHAGALFLVASQFNLLEMVHPDVGPEDGIARYAGDLTQGPACAMACAAGTIMRNYLAPVRGGVGQARDRQIDAAEDLHAALGGDIWEMRNGYALPLRGGLERAACRIEAADRDALMGALRLGLQMNTEVTSAGAGHRIDQVYASAMPVAYSHEPVHAWEPLARLVLDAAYEATLRLAARRESPVFLTLLGAGAFGNPPGWSLSSIGRAMRALPEAGLDLRLVSYGGSRHDADELGRLGAAA